MTVESFSISSPIRYGPVSELPVSAVKMVVGAVAATTVIPEIVQHTVLGDDFFLGIPLSILYAALAGSFIGFVILPDSDARRTNSSCKKKGLTFPQIKQQAARWIGLGSFLALWAIMASWLVMVLPHFFPVLSGIPDMPAAGITGAFVRRYLPRFLKVLEQKTEGLGEEKNV